MDTSTRDWKLQGLWPSGRIVIIAAALTLILPPLSGQAVSFYARMDYAAPEADWVQVGDVNGDGIPDILCSGPIVFFGNGDGTFRQGPASSLEGGEAAAVGDFNGDGKLDVANGNLDVGLQIAFGNGDGTFAPPVTYTVAGSPRGIAVADLNGDHHPDLAVATTLGLSILLNRGDGTFQSAGTYFSGHYAYAVAVGNINRDGIPDLAVGVAPGLVILEGTGGGSFRQTQSFTLPYTAASIGLADLNGDGYLDMVSGGGGLFVSTKEADVFFGSATGSFAQPYAISFPEGMGQIALGDVNGDGATDLVVAAGSARQVTVLLNNGKGRFGDAKAYSVASSLEQFVLAPLRKPGVPDFVSTNPFAFNLSVLLNQGDGTYKDCPRIPLSALPGPLAAADFNGDGLDDLAVTTASGVSVYLNTGALTHLFQLSVTIPLTSPVFTLTGDFNGDGKPDLAVALASGEVDVFLNQGDGQFTQASATQTGNTPGFIPLDIFAADLNGDGKLDLVTTFNQIFLGNGDGTFQAPIPMLPGFGGAFWIVPADLNGDGKTDLLAMGESEHLLSLINQGDAKFSVNANVEVPSQFDEFVVGDFNGDGFLDVAAPSLQFGVFICFGTAGGGFEQPINLPKPPLFGFGAVAGDFNGDGIEDFAISTAAGSDVAVFTSNGDGTFQSPPYFGTAYNATYMVKGHFNKNGTKPDLAVSAPDGVDILINTTR